MSSILLLCADNSPGRPRIDLNDPRNWATPLGAQWLEIFAGRAPRADLPNPPGVYVNHPDALLWDCYDEDLGELFSQRLLELIRPALHSFQIVECSINEVPYYYILPTKRYRVIDHSRSTMDMLPSGRVDRFYHYSFKDLGQLYDPMIFCIPEKGFAKYATPGVRELVEQSGCRGIVFEELP